VTVAIRAGPRTVEVSRPDKALFPSGITKADLARYYDAVAWAMLPHVAGRPLNLERYPDGIEGPRIIQQRAGAHFPDWIQRATVPKKAERSPMWSPRTRRRSCTWPGRPASPCTRGSAAPTVSTTPTA
jgi:DNA primase